MKIVETLDLHQQVLNVEEVSGLLRCSQRTVEDLARAGQLPGLKFGTGGWVFPTRALLDHINAAATTDAVKRKQPHNDPPMAAYARTAQ